MLYAPSRFPRQIPYKMLKPLPFAIGVICANWSQVQRTFP